MQVSPIVASEKPFFHTPRQRPAEFLRSSPNRHPNIVSVHRPPESPQIQPRNLERPTERGFLTFLQISPRAKGSP